MKLLLVLVAMSLAAALPGVQSCCIPSAYASSNNAFRSFQRDLHLDRVPEVLTTEQRAAFVACQNEWAERVKASYGVVFKFPEYNPRTYPGRCNTFGCNCDFCYGTESCQGTNDGDPNDQYKRWRLIGDRQSYIVHECPALRNFTNVPGYTPVCATASASAGASTTTTTTATAIAPAERACADKDKVLNATLPELAAVLSSLYCASAGGSVGLEFTASLLASLDADRSGSVDCAEWGIAKQTATLRELEGGRYFGPAKLKAPLCKLTAEGREELARYDAYLGRLTLGTLALNTTAAVANAASSAVVTVENDIVAGSAAGALLAARDKVAAAWNATARAVSG